MKKLISLFVISAFLLTLVPLPTAMAENDNNNVVDLLAGQTEKVGEVTTWNDGENIYVKYEITVKDWCITETHVHVGKTLDDFPRAGRQLNPVPGQFDYKEKHDPCVEEYTEEIPLGDWKADDELLIAAHAVIERFSVESFSDCLVSDHDSDDVLLLLEDGDYPGYPEGYIEPYQDYFGTTTKSFLTWTHPAWGPYGVEGAEWISSAPEAEYPDDNTWRLFTREFTIPVSATNISGELTMNCDNAQEVYLNKEFVGDGSPAIVYGPTPPNVGGQHGWDSVENYDISLQIVAGDNSLWTMTRNYGWPGGPYANPTGLIYELCYSYDIVTWEDETAWANGKRFTSRGNWATYFEYTVQKYEVTLLSVEYVGTCCTFGSHADETLTFTFSDDIKFSDGVSTEAPWSTLPPWVYMQGVSTIGTGPLTWSVQDDNKVVITTTGTFITPRPQIGDFVTGFERIEDKSGNPVVVLDGGVEVVKVGGECLVDEFNVNSADPAGTDSSETLAEGVNYRIKVSGTWSNKPSNPHMVDAKYISFDSWENYLEGYPDRDTTLLQLMVDEVFVDWGDYSDDHIYYWNMEGKGETVNLRVYDTFYGDNVGSFEVEIYRAW